MLKLRLKVRFVFCLHCYPVEQPGSCLWGDPAGKSTKRNAKNELNLYYIKSCVEFLCGWATGIFTHPIHPSQSLQFSTQLILGRGKGITARRCLGFCKNPEFRSIVLVSTSLHPEFHIDTLYLARAYCVDIERLSPESMNENIILLIISV